MCEDIVVVEYPCRLIYVILYNPVRVVLSILYYYIYYYYTRATSRACRKYDSM